MHAVHSARPVVDATNPGVHAMHTLSEIALEPVDIEYLPAAQSMQLVAPAVVLYLPAPQSMHDDCPAELYCPEPQSAQSEVESAENCPLPHAVHVVPAELTADPEPSIWTMLPAAQSAQSEVEVAEYFPLPHAVHVVPAEVTAAPVAPTWTMLPAAHVPHDVAACAEYVPAVQSMHAVTAVLPVLSTYLPATQSMQSGTGKYVAGSEIPLSFICQRFAWFRLSLQCQISLPSFMPLQPFASIARLSRPPTLTTMPQ
jgi:hypothetical protein